MINESALIGSDSQYAALFCAVGVMAMVAALAPLFWG